MLSEILKGLLIGSVLGTIPGLHINTFSNFFNNVYLILAIMITSNYFEFIKSTYLSIPNEKIGQGIRYSQELVRYGRGSETIKLLSSGALFSTLLIGLVAPLIVNYIPLIYKYVNKYVEVFLVLILISMIDKDNLEPFIFSSILGLIILKNGFVNQPLLPMLTGFYGLSNLIVNIEKKVNIPKQTKAGKIKRKQLIKGGLKAVIGSSLITFIPAIGPAQSSAIAGSLTRSDDKEKLITLGGVNTGDILFSITSLYTIQKARSGALQKLNVNLDYYTYLKLIFTCILCSVLCYFIINFVSKRIGNILSKINYTKLNIGLICLVVFVVGFISGFYGILVLVVATLIGVRTIKKRANPNILMSGIIVPVISYYF